MPTPLISVIVPIYNVEKYLDKCLKALINQTLKDIEIICVNDGSTDNSEIIVKEYAQMDNRIRYIYQENQGLSGARNTGIEHAKSPYLMFCDSDDWYEATMCEKMYKAITENDVDFAYCGTNVIYHTDEHLKKSDKEYFKTKFDGIYSITDNIINEMDVFSWNKIFKNSIIKKYNLSFPKGRMYEDACFFFQYIVVSQKFYALPQKLYNYVRRLGSIMNTTYAKNIKAIDHIKIMESFYNFLIKNNLYDKYKNFFYSTYLKYFHFAYNYLPQKDKKLAFDTAIPFMKTLAPEEIKTLSSEKQFIWKAILSKKYSLNTKSIKIKNITLIKIINKCTRYQIKILGINLFSKKLKKNKVVYSVLYIPIFKTKI